MFIDKKTTYSSTISLTEQEVADMADGTITGFNLDTPYANIKLNVCQVGKPTRLPMKDKETLKFIGWTPYYVAKFVHPSGTFLKNGRKTRVFSPEEIAALNKESL